MKEEINTFGNYEFDEWIPQEIRDSIVSFCGCFGRNHKEWIENGEIGAMQTCNHGPGPNGFGNPPYGATADYLIYDYKLSKENGDDIFRVVRGRYVHKWNNIGCLVDEHGQPHHVSSCNRWVRVWTKEEKS